MRTSPHCQIYLIYTTIAIREIENNWYVITSVNFLPYIIILSSWKWLLGGLRECRERLKLTCPLIKLHAVNYYCIQRVWRRGLFIYYSRTAPVYLSFADLLSTCDHRECVHLGMSHCASQLRDGAEYLMHTIHRRRTAEIHLSFGIWESRLPHYYYYHHHHRGE